MPRERDSMHTSKSYTAAMQRVDALLRVDLSHAEDTVLRFIIQRTLRFDKRAEYIPLRHFLKGVFDSYGDIVAVRATTSKPSLLKAIRGLEQKGYIAVSNTRGANLYTVLVENMIAIGCKIMSKLKVSKKRKELDMVQNETTGGSELNQEVVQNETNISKGVLSNRSEVTDAPGADAMESVRETLTASTERSKKAALRKAERARVAKTKENTVATWKVALRSHFPHATAATPKLTPRQWGSLKSASKQLKPKEYVAVLDWSVENWSTLTRHDLSWVENMNDVPNLPLFSTLFRYFYEAYLKREIRDDATRASAGHTGAASESELAEVRKELEASQKATAEAQDTAQHLRRRINENSTPRRRRRSNNVIPDELPEWEND